MRNKTINKFRRVFKSISPTHFIRAPGRVNLIGEHTDYNDGFVLPMAINHHISLAIAPRKDHQIRIYSANFHRAYNFPLQEIQKRHHDGWLAYPKAIAWALQEAGHTLTGFTAVLNGNIPRGAGLSSSAALELAIARALCVCANIPWQPLEMAKLAQHAENQWVGVNCGIMDQMIVARARQQHALLIDCRDFSTQNIPLPEHTAIVIMDTGTRRGLIGSAYNERRQQCEHAAQLLEINSLRDLDAARWERAQRILPPPCLMRARHVFTENDRVLQASQAMCNQNPNKLGELMYESHVSLRDDFAVSGEALNCIVETAIEHPACYGARMTGAGFAGCAVALVHAQDAKSFAEYVSERYAANTINTPALYITGAREGVSCTEL